MNLKDRTNLLKDLCARIPYGVKCQCLGRIGTVRSIDTFGNTEVEGFSGSIVIDVSHVKLYLFPLSSMTEEQKAELDKAIYEDGKEAMNAIRNNDKMFHTPWRATDWLNKNHFDYRGLISMGLANNALGLNIY